MSDLIPGNTSSNTPIAIGSSVSGRLDFNGDTDWYRATERIVGASPLMPVSEVDLIRAKNG